MRINKLALSTLCCLIVANAPAIAAGDPAAGRTKAGNCIGCHGITSYSNVYPTYSVPRLGGQHPDYIVAALQAYKSGDRKHSTMRAQAADLSDQDMHDIASYFATFSAE